MDTSRFCTLNFTLVKHLRPYYWWPFQNGSTSFCYYVPQCMSEFEPDTDIAGWGVITAFLVVAWPTIIVAAVNAFFPTRDTYQSFRRHRLLEEHVTSKPPARRSCLEKFTDHILLVLCDLQIVTATVILTAGFAQWTTISFYHRAVVDSLANLTIGSFWASRASGQRTIEAKEASALAETCETVRTLFIMAALVLLAAFISLETRSWDREWHPFVTGKCFRSHDYASIDSQWLWVAGYSSYALAILLRSMFLLFPGGDKKWEDGTRFLPEKLKEVGEVCLLQADEIPNLFHTCFEHTALRQRSNAIKTLGIRCAELTGMTVILGLVWAVLQYWAIWGAGQGFQAVEVRFYAGFALWNSFDVIDLKYSNSSLLTALENSWGFGQVLPLYLLFMIGFNVLDAAEKSFTIKYSRRKDSIVLQYRI